MPLVSFYTHPPPPTSLKKETIDMKWANNGKTPYLKTKLIDSKFLLNIKYFFVICIVSFWANLSMLMVFLIPALHYAYNMFKKYNEISAKSQNSENTIGTEKSVHFTDVSAMKRLFIFHFSLKEAHWRLRYHSLG